jgi:hypothetical protein
MRSTLAAVPILLSFSTIAAAQASGPIAASRSPVMSGEEVVARLMQFDRDNDGHVARAELNERMQHLVARGDRNGDGALERVEILDLANAPVPLPTQIRFVHYGFSDELLSSVSPRSHIEGALEDLRLPSAVNERATARVQAYVDVWERAATAPLLKEMEGTLTAEQMVEFREALAELLHGQASRPVLNDGPAQARRFLDLSLQTAFIPARGTCPGPGVFCNQVPGSTFKVADVFTAAGALKRVKAQLTLDDAARSALLEQLRDVLTDEELDDFRAALERRPLVGSHG